MIITHQNLSNRDRSILKRAIDISRTSTCKQKHGAVIYKGGRVLSVGVNRFRNEHASMEISKSDYTTHAEQAALDVLGGRADGCTIYIARTNRQGNPVNSAPCARCTYILEVAGIKRVVYTA